MDAIAISRSGLDVEWRRMEIIALNLANIESSAAPGGKPYLPLRLVSGPSESFGQVLDGLQNRAASRSTGSNRAQPAHAGSTIPAIRMPMPTVSSPIPMSAMPRK